MPTDPTLGLPRNYLRACVLLMLADDSSHGYELLDGLKELGLGRTDPGGLYRALRSMEQEDLVLSWWEDSPSGPARRTYALTEEGHRHLASYAASVEETIEFLTIFQSRWEVASGAEQADAASRVGG